MVLLQKNHNHNVSF